MNISLPPRLRAALERALDWLNISLWVTPPIPIYGKPLDISRIDVILVTAGTAGTIYYGVIGGWRGAAYAGLSFALGVMTALWII